MGTISQGSQHPGIVSLFDSAGWSWFTVPIALHHQGRSNQTYISWLDREGKVWIGAYDHATSRFTPTVLAPLGEVDDHDVAAILLRADGRLSVFYTKHNRDAFLRYRVSTHPEDSRSWEAEQSLPTPSGTVTYAQVWRWETTVVVFYRILDRDMWYWACRVSKDDGQTWGPEQRVVRHGLQFYIKGTQHPIHRERLVFGVTQHPDRAGDRQTYSLYSMRVDLKTGDVLLDENGARLGNVFDGSQLPVEMTSLKLRWDATKDPDHGKAWIWDVSMDDGMRSWLWFAKIVSARDHRYAVVDENGLVYEFARAGGTIDGESEPSYSGGLTVPKVSEPPGTVWLVRQSSSGCRWTLEEWHTPDGGATWVTRELLRGGESHPLRPVAVVDADPSLPLVFLGGVYKHYTQVLTALYAYRLPV